MMFFLLGPSVFWRALVGDATLTIFNPWALWLPVKREETK